MTVFKKVVLSVPILLLCSGEAFATRDVFLGSGIRRGFNMSLQRARCALNSSVAAMKLGAAGETGELDIQRSGNSEGLSRNAANKVWNNLEKCERVLLETHRRFEEIKYLVETLKQEKDRELLESNPLLQLQAGDSAKNALVVHQPKPEGKLALVTQPDAVEAEVAEPSEWEEDESADSARESHEETNSKDSKNIQKLRRIYGLLPEYHGKSITGVLTGATVNKDLPVWNAVKDVIKKIEKEAFAAGDKTRMDLAYFQELYAKVLKVRPQGILNSGVYRISAKEVHRLNRIYELLPNHHGKSITGVLTGATVNKELPVWSAVMDVIKKIEKEATAKGEKISMDINYFRKLHYASVRVRGKGGGRKSGH